MGFSVRQVLLFVFFLVIGLPEKKPMLKIWPFYKSPHEVAILLYSERHSVRLDLKIDPKTMEMTTQIDGAAAREKDLMADWLKAHPFSSFERIVCVFWSL
jgi:hypothetical protein